MTLQFDEVDRLESKFPRKEVEGTQKIFAKRLENSQARASAVADAASQAVVGLRV